MNPEKQLLHDKQMARIDVREEKIQETIQNSKEAFLASEQEKILSYREFLWAQLQSIRKRWWVLQFLLLCILGATLVSAYEESDIQRGMGVMASMFVILIIPELWKNRSCRCMEIEEAAYYSLRRIYAARMLLFGIVDVLLLTLFCGTMTMGLHIAFTKLLTQFLLPMLVTACICFGTLCSRHMASEATAIIFCVLWCGIWLAITLNESIYEAVTLPVWMGCIILALCFLCITVYRAINHCGKYWEADIDGIKIE